MLQADESISTAASVDEVPSAERVSLVDRRLLEGGRTVDLRLLVGVEAVFCSPDIIHHRPTWALSQWSVIGRTRRIIVTGLRARAGQGKESLLEVPY